MKYPTTIGEYLQGLEKDLEDNKVYHKEVAERLAKRHRSGTPRWMADSDIFFWLQHRVQTKAYEWVINLIKTAPGELLQGLSTQIAQLQQLAIEEKARLAEAFEAINGQLPDGSHLSALEIEAEFLTQRRVEIAHILKTS